MIESIAAFFSGFTLFLKGVFPGVLGALMASKRVPRGGATVAGWLAAWLLANLTLLAITVVLVYYLGNALISYYGIPPTHIYADCYKLGIGLFGYRILSYVQERVDPIIGAILNAGLQALRVRLGLPPKDGDNL